MEFLICVFKDVSIQIWILRSFLSWSFEYWHVPLCSLTLNCSSSCDLAIVMKSHGSEMQILHDFKLKIIFPLQTIIESHSILFTNHPKIVTVFWAQRPHLFVTHVFLVCVLNKKPCHILVQYRWQSKKSDHLRTTYLAPPLQLWNCQPSSRLGTFFLPKLQNIHYPVEIVGTLGKGNTISQWNNYAKLMP